MRRQTVTDDLAISLLNVLGAIVFAYLLNRYIGRPVEGLSLRSKVRYKMCLRGFIAYVAVSAGLAAPA